MMAVFDTHRAFQALTAAGFTERQAQALIDVGSEGYGALATKADIADMATKADILLTWRPKLTYENWSCA